MNDLQMRADLLPNGARVVTVLRGERYVTEVLFRLVEREADPQPAVRDVAVARAENVERFEAGMAHGSYRLVYAQTPAEILRQEAEEAEREEREERER